MADENCDMFHSARAGRSQKTVKVARHSKGTAGHIKEGDTMWFPIESSNGGIRPQCTLLKLKDMIEKQLLYSTLRWRALIVVGAAFRK